MNKQKNFFNPANAQSSSEESSKEKRHTFIALYSLFTWVQYANTEFMS